MTETTDYRDEAKSDARDMATEFLSEIVDNLCNGGEASDDLLNDYPNGDSYHHETHVDKSYSLSEATALLDQLDYYEETDNGLWEGLAPREAISAQAAYTYGNAVASMWQDLIKEINGDDDIEELYSEYQATENYDEEEGGEKPTRPTIDIHKAMTAATEEIIKNF